MGKWCGGKGRVRGDPGNTVSDVIGLFEICGRPIDWRTDERVLSIIRTDCALKSSGQPDYRRKKEERTRFSLLE